MLKLRVSTDGLCKPRYHDLSGVEDERVVQAEDIRYGRLTGKDGDVWLNRSYAFIELNESEALGLAIEILMGLVDSSDSRLVGWNLKFPDEDTAGCHDSSLLNWGASLVKGQEVDAK